MGLGGNCEKTRSKKSRDTVPRDTGVKFAAGIVETGGKFQVTTGVVDMVAYLPPVSTASALSVAKFSAGVRAGSVQP